MWKKLIEKAINLRGFELRKIRQPKDDTELYLRLFGEDSVIKRRFYNISAGGHFDFGCGIHHPCWTNVDVDRKWEKGIVFNPTSDIAYDPLLKKKLPIESNTAELVHSRVTIEHMDDESAQFLLQDIFRILKNNGIFRVVTPNIDLDHRALLNNDKDYFYWLNNYSIEQSFLDHFAHGASDMNPENAFEKISDDKFQSLFKEMYYEEALDYCTSKCDMSTQTENRSHHVNWWNQNKLTKMLKNAGFKTIYLSAAQQSCCPVLRNESYFDNFAQKAMLYMEAIKK
jgi:SAM-dependent methyltransferase